MERTSFVSEPEGVDSELVKMEIMKHRCAARATPRVVEQAHASLLTPLFSCIAHRNSITEASRSFAIPAYRDDLEEEDVDGDVSMLGTTPMETRTLRFTSSLEPATREISARAELGGADIVRDLLLYDNPMLSGLVAVLGLAVLALGHYLLSGSHGWRLVPTLSHAALCVVAFNMFRGLLVRGWTSNAAGSGTASAAAELAAAAVCGVAGLYDAYLASPDAAVSLRSVLALWGLARLGGVVGLWTTLSILFVGAFTVPVALATFEAQISELRALIGGSVQVREILVNQSWALRTWGL